MSEQPKKGGISVDAEHIFPVIKKWLYSDKEIFLREIVSNAVDAETKLKRLVSLGEIKDLETGDLKVTVTLDKEAKTITVRDNGIGMTADEIEKYICSIALSGALDFIKTYEGEGDGAGAGIIGHFGLGFYSAFMVSDRVDVISKSYKDEPATFWTCTSDGSFEMSSYDEAFERGTSIVMHIGEEGSEYLGEYELRKILDKYCSFLPYPIYFTVIKPDDDSNNIKEEKKEEEKEEEPKPINDTHPLWLKNASDCTKDEYVDFYRKVFNDWREPLLTIHINADYPLNFKGILYFPKRENEFENPEGKIKLYYNQVFVADNIKEVVPEYLLMLRGVLDCPELPLNVSRSYLQNDAYVKKIAQHITKKVADKLVAMKENEREQYEKIWSDIRTFAEYSCICDAKFCDRARGAMLLELTDGKFKTLDEYLEEAKDKHENIVYYTADKQSQAQFVDLYAKQGIAVAVFDRFVDTQFISTLEGKVEKLKFVRVDADVDGALKSEKKPDVEKNDDLEKIFREESGNEKLKLSFECLNDEEIPAILNLPEEARRFDDMMKMYSTVNGVTAGKGTAEENLKLNLSNPVAAQLAAKTSFNEKDRLVVRQIYGLAAISQRKLSAEELSKFLANSYEILSNINNNN